MSLQGTSSCNRRQDTFECFEVDKMKGTLSIAAGFSSVSSIRGFGEKNFFEILLKMI